MNIDLLAADLQRDEGWKNFLYDDANGAKIVPGYTVKGHATAAWGFALDVSPLTQEEALPILRSRAQGYYDTLVKAEPWVAGLPEPVQRGLSNMAYNMGVTGLLKFNTFLDLLKAGQYVAAGEDLAQTKWAGQVGDRASRVVALIEQGAMGA